MSSVTAPVARSEARRQGSSQVWRDWFTLYGSVLVSQSVGIARSLAVARFLGPEAFGLWKLLQLIASYTRWADLGAVAGMTRQVPVFRGEGRASGGLAVQQAAWAMTVLPTAIVALGLVVAGIWTGDGPLGPALIAFASLLVSMRLLTYFDELAGSQKLFHLRSRATLGLALVDGVLAPIAAWYGGLVWFVCSISLTNALVASFLAVRQRVSLRISWNTPAIRALILVGGPMAVTRLLFELLNTADRTVIGAMLGAKAVGFYGLAMVVRDMAIMVPIVCSQVLLPHVAERFGRDRDPRALFDQIEHVTKIVTRLLPVPLGLLWFVLPGVAAWILPAYVPGVGAAQVLSWATLFFAIHSTASVVLVSLGRVTLLTIVHGGGALLGAALCAAAASAGLELVGVAWAMVATYAALAATVLVLAAMLCGRSASYGVGAFISLCAPGVCVLAGVRLFGETLTRAGTLATAGVLGVALALAVALLWPTVARELRASGASPEPKAWTPPVEGSADEPPAFPKTP